jgi:hypothetical protein
LTERNAGVGESTGAPDGVQGQGREQGAEATLMDGSIPADADLDMPSDAMNDPEQLEK